MTGKRRKDSVDCAMCNGRGYTRYNNDNKEERVTCAGCNGTGKQP